MDEAVFDAFESAWQRGERPDIADFVQSVSGREAHLAELLQIDLEYRIKAGDLPSIEQYRLQFPQLFSDHPELLCRLLEQKQRLEQRQQDSNANGPLDAAKTLINKQEEGDGSSAEVPQHIGRYRIDKVLGKGGFGLVYLAHDDQLQRLVAIKVPHPHLVAQITDAEAYLTEARTVASLDYSNIVPVFDVGSSDQFPCFVVSKYIDGTDLATRLKQSRLPRHQAVELVATVADALHHAHKQGLIHRDIKPGNILLDASGKPFVADFGLALQEQDSGKGPGYVGTPAYMSPEQACGEGHRVDGRSDIFSLGVVFYELLVGRRPFKADSQIELLEQITSVEARPPRQIDDTIPKELDRICLKALSKRSSERYSAAKDMAEDLRHVLVELPSAGGSTINLQQPNQAEFETPVPTPTTAQDSGNQLIRIVPKGLRSFDAGDADFFLELLPGPRDRNGLPDSIRFWKTRIEESNPDNTFSVGLIYGPSGCGKSSLVKAGLLPRLAKSVSFIYIEATADETESRLLKGLRRQVPGLPGNLDLIESLTALRRGRFLQSAQKVLIVLDQFEQWLHARKEERNTELVQTLRQCDGGRLQCIVMVRDDFGMAATRFMAGLDIPILQGSNFATVDLFDPIHARKVLAAFGRAFGRLPDNLSQCSKVQDTFVDQAVAGLAQEGKVISVRLALFAEMVKGKPWTNATLKAVGGTEGVGVTFLEETFTASTAPPQHRMHQKAARAVLKALLPEVGTDIKGHMRSQQELLEASGYGNRPKEFDELIRILDSEIRLITPTDPEGKEDADASPVQAGTKYFQLTHDYLVPSLRDWLTRKQKETRRGRAELLLADRAVVWNARPENRQLPSLLQWFQIVWWTPKTSWTPAQRKMMGRAGRLHQMRGVAVAVFLAMATFMGLAIRARTIEERNQAAERQSRTYAEGLVQSVLKADTAQAPAIITQMSEYRRWTDPLLREGFDKAATNSPEKLHASLALLPIDSGQVDYLYGRLLNAKPNEVSVISDALSSSSHKDALVEKLWAVVENTDKDKEPQRLRAGAALAKYAPEAERWDTASVIVVNDLVVENPVYLERWSEAFRPVKNRLLPRLSEVFRGRQPDRTAERTLATSLLADYAADNTPELANLLMDADEKQFGTIFPKFADRGEQGMALLATEIEKQLPVDLPSSDEHRETLAKRQANAAVALLKLNQPEKVWPLLKHSPDPRVRSYLIHRLSSLGADPQVILQHLNNEPDITIRRALLLSIGEFGAARLSPEVRTALLPQIREMYQTAADPGLHAAAEWLLRQFNGDPLKEDPWCQQVNAEWAKHKSQRQQRQDEIQQVLAKDKEKATPQWYVNSHGQTMVVIPGPVEFVMGSPLTEADRISDETQHKRKIGRTFALAATPVTKEQFLRFAPAFTFTHTEFGRYPEPTCPIGGVIWSEAAAYCNWLSKEEGIAEDQWIYEFTDTEIKLKAKYLSLSGYRLPTEAEMEYATRAGAVTSRYYGETDDLLAKYAWSEKNSQDKTWPVGMLKPTDFGLFDVQGNVFTWCQERYLNYPEGQQSSDDIEDSALVVTPTDSRVLRGGSFYVPSSIVRSAFHTYYVQSNLFSFIGFRLARTLPPIPLTALPLSPEGGEIEKRQTDK